MRPARLDHSFFDNEPRSHLGALLLRKGLVTNTELDRALEELLRAIPLRLHPDGTVSVAVADPTDETLLPKLKLALGTYEVRLLVTMQSALRAAWAQAYPV